MGPSSEVTYNLNANHMGNLNPLVSLVWYPFYIRILKQFLFSLVNWCEGPQLFNIAVVMSKFFLLEILALSKFFRRYNHFGIQTWAVIQVKIHLFNLVTNLADVSYSVNQLSSTLVVKINSSQNLWPLTRLTNPFWKYIYIHLHC